MTLTLEEIDRFFDKCHKFFQAGDELDQKMDAVEAAARAWVESQTQVGQIKQLAKNVGMTFTPFPRSGCATDRNVSTTHTIPAPQSIVDEKIASGEWPSEEQFLAPAPQSDPGPDEPPAIRIAALRAEVEWWKEEYRNAHDAWESASARVQELEDKIKADAWCKPKLIEYKARIAELEGALRPFAECLNYLQLTQDVFNNARAALKGGEKPAYRGIPGTEDCGQ
jgi:hypothetical protein